MNTDSKNNSSSTLVFGAAGGTLGASASWIDHSLGAVPGEFLPFVGTIVGMIAGVMISRVFQKMNASSAHRNAETPEAEEPKKTEILVSEPEATTHTPPRVPNEIKVVEEYDVLDGISHTVTKLDLAHSYIEMGDLDLAHSILNEVLQDQQSINEDVLVLQEARK